MTAGGGGRAMGLVSRISVLAMSTMAVAVVVPESMQISTSLQQFLPSLYQAPLQAVQFGRSFLGTNTECDISGSAGSCGAVVTLSDTSTTLQQAAKVDNHNDQNEALVSLCFVVRRPG